MSEIYKKIRELQEMNPTVANENANKNAEVFNTKRDLLAGVVSKEYALTHLLPHDIAYAHQEGIIHFHDLDYFPMIPYFNCMLIDFEGMLKNGFRMGTAPIESPKSINTAAALVGQIVANVSSNMYGGTSFNRADEVLEPYAKLTYEKWLATGKEYMSNDDAEVFALSMTKKSIYDAMQSLEYELNTLYNSNGQTPFFTLNFGLGTSWYAREIQKAILNIRIKGLGKDGKTPVFPKLVFTLKDGVNLKPTDPNYDIKKLALECTSKRMYPDIVNYDKIVEITGDFKAPMGCRSFLGSYKDENGNFITSGRMNMGVVSLNLPNIALSTESIPEFFELMKDRMKICKKALDYRISVLNLVKAKNAPILYMYGATGHRLKADDSVADVFKNGYASISMGYIGIHEAVAKFYGADWHKNDEAVDFSLRILKLMKDTAEEWKEENGYGYSIYGTPSESLCDRFCRLDKEHFGVVENITDKEWYTNSFHYYVRCKITPFEKVAFEAKYAPYTNGGFIHYAEFPSLVNNIEGLERFWDYCYSRVGYVGTNTPVDKCYECGYEGEFFATSKGFVCPQCGNSDPSTASCTRRLCGYLGNVMEIPPNNGKKNEMKNRVKHA